MIDFPGEIGLMPQVKKQPALQEIKDSILNQDTIKARLVMDHFPDLPPAEQRGILFELARSMDEFAIPILSYLLIKHQNTTRDFPTLSGTIQTKAMDSPEVIVNALSEDNPENIYYFKLVGELNLQQAVPNLIKQALLLKDNTALITILTTLGKLGNPEAIDAITEYLHVEDYELAATAIAAMGQIATPTAIQHLAVLLGKDSKQDRLILNLLADIQDEFSLRKLNETLQFRTASIRNHARSLLTTIGVKAVPMLIENIASRNVDLQILSLNILQEIGDESAALAIRNLINVQPPDPNVRFAAFEALADLSNRRGDYVLAGGLVDPDSSVRVAAAKAIDRNLEATLVAGIKNMVERPGEDASFIVKAIIDAQAGNLFLGLSESEEFKKLASKYLGEDVHQDIREYFVKLLEKENSAELVDSVQQMAQKQEKQVKGRICAVDDSGMILSIYRSVITELGYEVVLFSKPREAISWLREEKPDFLCTDLNMPEITGIELIQEVRKTHGKNELPIILITTQNEVQDNTAAWEAGVSDIMYKPFNADMMSTVLTKLMDR